MEEVNIRTVGVAGAGTMGAGIAQLFAYQDFDVCLFDVSHAALEAAETRIHKGLERAEKPAAFSRVRKTTRLDPLSACELVVEAAVEDLSVKQGLFRQLDAMVEPPRILATNTSSLSVSRIASAAENPDRIVGLHFFNPAPIMRLVEVVRAERSSAGTIKTACELVRRLGKTPILCRDTPGFVANRVARPFYLEGMRLLEAGAGDPADIDAAVREAGLRMGPLELVDLIGLDVNLTISRTVYEALGRPERLKPLRVQEDLVSRGCLGRKNGRGFYVYGGTASPINPMLGEIVPRLGSKPRPAREIFDAVLGAVIEEARAALGERVAEARDIDTAMRLGLNWPKGPLEWAAERR